MHGRVPQSLLPIMHVFRQVGAALELTETQRKPGVQELNTAHPCPGGTVPRQPNLR